jgi:hypothetical protein
MIGKHNRKELKGTGRNGMKLSGNSFAEKFLLQLRTGFSHQVILLRTAPANTGAEWGQNDLTNRSDPFAAHSPRALSRARPRSDGLSW